MQDKIITCHTWMLIVKSVYKLLNVSDDLKLTCVQTHIALSRDPSTRHLDGQFQIWTGEIF